jgi:hypothetical protein
VLARDRGAGSHEAQAEHLTVTPATMGNPTIARISVVLPKPLEQIDAPINRPLAL